MINKNLMQSIVVFGVTLTMTILAGCAHISGSSKEVKDASSNQVADTMQSVNGNDNEVNSKQSDVRQVVQPIPLAAGVEETVTAVSKPTIQEGSSQFINAAAASKEQQLSTVGDVTFNFENTPVQVVIKAILGELLQENYVIAPGVQGNVTFATAKPINADQARSVLETLLSWNNLALVLKDGRYTVLPVGQAIPGNLSPRSGASAARGYEVRVVPLKYISATEMEKILTPYVKQGAIVRADNARSMVVLAGNNSDLQVYMDTIEVFDVDWLKGMSVGIYPLERVEAKVVVPELDKIFGESANTPLAGMFRFMPIDRMNAVLVITTQPEYLKQAEDWLGKLDRGGSDAGLQLYVYYVRNVKAVDLAGNLSEIFGGSNKSKSTSSTPIGSVVPGVQSVEVKSINSPDKSRPSYNSSSGISISESSDIRISAIEESNALLIRSTASQYDSILAAIRRLDIEPLQVHIEAQILQVDLTGGLSYGVRWFFENSTSDANALDFRVNNRGYGTANEGSRDAWVSFAGTTSSDGLGWTFLNTSAESIISTLQTKTNVRVLSAPSLVVLNNKSANINVGTQIPVVSSSIYPTTTSVTGTAATTPTSYSGYNQSYVQFRDTGIILSVTPRVNPGGLVYMEIEQEQSTPGAIDTTGNASIDRRVVKNEVSEQSGETVLLAGLIKEAENKGRSGVPGLMNIPIIGNLFSTSTNSNDRQELLVLIKPTVISSAQQARSLTEDYRNRFKGIQPLLKQLDEQQSSNQTSAE